MALATQCPHCHTTFRVAHDQLKLRAGLVRCGACKQIFNGIENLLRPDELEQAPGSFEQPTESHSAEAASPISPPNEETPNHTIDGDTPLESAENADTSPSINKNPLLRMTLMDVSHERGTRADHKPEETAATTSDEPDPIEQAIDDLEHKPWRNEQDASTQTEADALDQVEAAEYEEPSFVKRGRRKQRIGYALRIVMAATSALLLGAFLVQGAYVFRNQIAAWFPQTKPILASACAHLGCQVGLPSRIESISIESNELQTLGANTNTFALSVLLRNHGSTVQAWPNIELTLNDANEKAIARRVFVPREYLPSTLDVNKGFAARSEQPIKLFFELSQLKASGYNLYLFYP